MLMQSINHSIVPPVGKCLWSGLMCMKLRAATAGYILRGHENGLWLKDPLAQGMWC